MLFSTLLTTTVVIVLAHLIRNYFAVPTTVPGPFLARFSDLWRAYKEYNGLLRSELTKLHAKHGPLVRYGVRSISVSDPSVVDMVYGSRSGFVVAHSYNVLVGISNGKEVPSLVSTRDETRHGQLRRSVAGAFTVRGAQDYECFVDATIPDLIRALHRDPKTDLPHLLMLYSMDSAARMAFSESLGCLESGTDNGGSIELIRDRFRHWGWWSSLPWLERLVYRNAWAMRRSKGKTPSAMVSTAVRKLRDRMSEKGQSSDDILHKFIEAHRANPNLIDQQGIVSLLMSTISGAGDTTATTITAVLFFLYNHTHQLEKLRKELVQANVKNDEVPQFATTNKLPYLAAVIKESMRLFPTATWPIERLVPAEGITIAGADISPGTSVGIFVSSLHLTKDTFGEDANEFRPERWIEADEDRLKTMEHAFMGFSRRRRICLGQNVALMQMKKVVPALVMSFDLEFVQADAHLEADMSLAVAAMKPLWVKAEPRS